MQQIELLVLIPISIGFLIAFYLIERRIPENRRNEMQRGRAMIRLVEEKLSSEEYEPFLYSLFDAFENAPENSSEGKREYDAGKTILLQRQDIIGIRFQKTYQKWLLQNNHA